MRNEPTKAEKIALALLNRELTARGTRPMYSLDITDSPDALFLVEGRPIAIECRYIAHPKLLEFKGRRDLIPNVPYEVVVPREPHLWVRDAIIEKNKKIKKYMENTGAVEAWLVVHSSSLHAMLKGDQQNDDIFKTLLAYGTHLVEHSFTRIWFAETGGHLQEAIEIYGPEIEPTSFDWDGYVSAFAPGYPCDTHWHSNPIIQEDSEGAKFVRLNLNDDRGRAIGLQPLDTNHKIDYSYLSDPQRNSNRKNLKWAFYDEKPEH